MNMQDPLFGDAVDVLEGRGVVEVDVQGVFPEEVHDGFDGLLIIGTHQEGTEFGFRLGDDVSDDFLRVFP